MIRRKFLSPQEATREELSAILGSKLSFAAAEAYKLLRTNLVFALADEQGCRVIGITSSLRSEGKSTTSVNLGYTIAETGQKVLLVESDMRLPTFARRFGIAATPGLSNVLAGWNKVETVIQKSGLHENLFCISSGDIPPNPAELLCSNRMKNFIEEMKEKFDYIILDLPPVTVVSDALIISPFIHGILVVVRQDYSERRLLAQAMRQLKFAKIKILGFVLTGAGSRKAYGRYGKSKKYGQYNSRYGYGASADVASSGKDAVLTPTEEKALDDIIASVKK